MVEGHKQINTERIRKSNKETQGQHKTKGEKKTIKKEKEELKVFALVDFNDIEFFKVGFQFCN